MKIIGLTILLALSGPLYADNATVNRLNSWPDSQNNGEDFHAFSDRDSIGIYHAGGNVFQMVVGDASYVSSYVSGRPLGQWTRNGCCAGGTSSYFRGGKFNVGAACASSRSAAREAAADACLNRWPHIRCDWSVTSECSNE